MQLSVLQEVVHINTTSLETVKMLERCCLRDCHAFNSTRKTGTAGSPEMLANIHQLIQRHIHNADNFTTTVA